MTGLFAERPSCTQTFMGWGQGATGQRQMATFSSDPPTRAGLVARCARGVAQSRLTG